ncbi:hypothetical protein LZ30DRAFT_708911 [Colletotrichum cereale]|nr:hypothetical protein LZ30DRAFT_708911 [Colletotrichum cereale]
MRIRGNERAAMWTWSTMTEERRCQADGRRGQMGREPRIRIRIKDGARCVTRKQKTTHKGSHQCPGSSTASSAADVECRYCRVCSLSRKSSSNTQGIDLPGQGGLTAAEVEGKQRGLQRFLSATACALKGRINGFGRMAGGVNAAPCWYWYCCRYCCRVRCCCCRSRGRGRGRCRR